MSIKIMDMVFKDENLDSNKKLVMLALGDNANDEGFCYPSLNTIVKKTSLSKPTVIKHIKELEDKNLLLSKKRSKKSGGRYTSIYIIYPQINVANLDKELLERFELNNSQSKEVLPHTQSKAALPQEGIQSKEVLLKPSLTLFNHHLFNKLNKEEKDLFLEYSALRKKMKLQTTLSIQERLLKKYFEYGRNIEIIQNAISSNWKDFYPLRQQTTQPQYQNQQPAAAQGVDPFELYTDYRNKGMDREVAETRVITETGMKYPATDRFLKATANAEYEFYMKKRAAQQQTKQPVSDEDYQDKLLKELYDEN